MNEKKRMARAFAFFAPIMGVLMRLRFGYRCDSLKGIPGPYLLLCNHNMELDPVLLGAAGGWPVRFVASEHIARKGFGTWFLMRYFRPILHVKGKSGQGTSLKMIRALRDGESVAMFPEGNRSFTGVTGPILGQLGRMVRRCGASLVTYRIEGGYLTQPRWGTTLRRGRLVGHLAGVYTPEQLSEMTDSRVDEIIARDLHEDAYETQKTSCTAYRGSNLAVGLESALFLCPACGGVGTMESSGDTIACSCGFGAKYDVYGNLTCTDGAVRTVRDWDAWQQQALAEKLQSAGGEALFCDKVTVRVIRGDHTAEEPKTVTLCAYRDHLQLGGEALPWDTVTGVAVFSRNVLNVHTDKLYEIRGDMRFNALKYRYLNEIRKK